jgi:hypothetical protein
MNRVATGHPLFTTSRQEPVDVLTAIRQGQHHEQAYLVGVHDQMFDAVPPSYDKDSPDPMRPRWQPGGLQMIGWLVALVYNAVANVSEKLARGYGGSHIRTLLRMFFNRPRALYQTPEAVIVSLDPFAGPVALVRLIDEFNAQAHRLPWLQDRPVVVSLTLQTRPRPGPSRLIDNN